MSILLEALKKAQEEKVLRSSLKEMPEISSEQLKVSASSGSDDQISEEDLAILLSRTQIPKKEPRASSADLLSQTPSEQRNMEQNPLRLNSDEESRHDEELASSNSLETREETGDLNLSSLSLSTFEEGETTEAPKASIKEASSEALDDGLSLTLATPDAPLSKEEKTEKSIEDESEQVDPIFQELDRLLHQAEEVNDAGVEKNISEVESDKKDSLKTVESDDIFKLELPTHAEQEDSKKDKKTKGEGFSIEEVEIDEKSSLENNPTEVESQQTKTEEKGGQSDASYDWSLSQIPGFDTETKAPEPEVKKVRESKSFVSLFKRGQQSKPDYRKKKGRLKKWLMFFATTTTFIAVAGYFGWEYSKILQSEVSFEVIDYQHQLAQIHHNTLEKLEINAQKEKQDPKLATQKKAEQKSAVPQQQKAVVKTQSKPKVQKHAPVKKVAHAAHVLKPTSQPSSGMMIQSQIEKDLRLQAYEAFEKGDYAQAQQLYRSAALKHPSDINVWLGLGASSLALGERDNALKYYRQAFKLEPSNADALKAVAMLNPKKNKNWEAQIKQLQRMRPRDPDISFMLGNHYLKQGDWLQAEKYFKKAAFLSPSSADILFNYALTLDHLGRFQMAKHYYQKALAVSSGQLSSATQKTIKNRIRLLEQFLFKTQQDR